MAGCFHCPVTSISCSSLPSTFQRWIFKKESIVEYTTWIYPKHLSVWYCMRLNVFPYSYHQTTVYFLTYEHCYQVIHPCCPPDCLGSRFPPSVISSVILPHICDTLSPVLASYWYLYHRECFSLAKLFKIWASEILRWCNKTFLIFPWKLFKNNFNTKPD